MSNIQTIQTDDLISTKVRNTKPSSEALEGPRSKIKGARQWIQWFLEMLGMLSGSKIQSKGARHWIQWLPEMLEMPSGVPTDPRTNWRLKASFLWTTWLSCFEVCTCLSDTQRMSRPERIAYVKESQKLASKLWNLEIVPWIVGSWLSTNKTSWVDPDSPGLWIRTRKFKMSISHRVRCPPTDVMRPEPRPLGGWFVRPGTPGRPAIFRLPEWSSCWASAVGPVHSIGKACASGLNLLLFLAQTKVCP